VSVDVPGDASVLDCVFNDGAGTWDNNNGADWHIDVQGGAPTWSMDGALDGSAMMVADGAGRTLHAGLIDGRLYLATEAAVGSDVFMAVSAESPGPLQPAMWGKAGNVAAWDAFLAQESTNGWNGWFNAGQDGEPTGGHASAGGGVLEGWIDLEDAFGAVPEAIAIAAVSYATDDGGLLDACCQAPESLDGDGDVQAVEFVIVDLCDFDPATCCDADVSGDGAVDVSDLLAVLADWAHAGGPADIDGDGVVGVDDLLAVIAAWGPC